MKMNMKCFGMNSVPLFEEKMKKYSLDNGDLLVIGYDVNLPKKASPKEKFDLKKDFENMENKHPAIVGICANKNKNPWAFSGDFFYQEYNNKEELSTVHLAKATQDIVESAVKHGRRPTRIIIVRDGLSEGQQSLAIKNELPAIRQGYKAGISKTAEMVNVEPKFTFIVASKMHNKRFYRNKNNIITNTAAGDVIDSKVTRTDVPEFYLQSHNPLKGVPKIPQYNVLANELGMSMNEIQYLMQLLSNMHQVSACPTSLPLPVYLADETAKRGQNIYNELVLLRTGREQNAFAPEIRMNKKVFVFDDLNARLGYSSSVLANTRYNA